MLKEGNISGAHKLMTITPGLNFAEDLAAEGLSTISLNFKTAWDAAMLEAVTKQKRLEERFK